MGKFQRKLFYLCGAGWLIDNLWLQVAALSLPYIQTEFQLSSTYAGVATTSALIGMMFGALFWGWIADRYGKRLEFVAVKPLLTHPPPS